MTTTPHYEKGSESKIAVVLSCPGKEEQSANKPAAGQTGKNLEEVLSILEKKYTLSDFKRGLATITNSWDRVEFDSEGGTDRTEADILEILEKENLNRLAKELEDVTDYIICCGIKSKISVSALQYAEKLNTNCKVLYVCHLGNQGINKTITHSLDGKEIKSYKNNSEVPSSLNKTIDQIKIDNRKLRLEVVAKKIHEQITS